MKVVNFRIAPYILLMLVVGIISAAFYNFYVSFTVSLIAFAIVILMRGRKYYQYVLIAGIAIVIGIVIASISLYISRPVSYEDSIITGRVTEDIGYENDSILFFIDDITIDDKNVRGKAYIELDSEEIGHHTLVNGDILTFRGDITSNPLDVWDSYSVLDYRKGFYYNADINTILNREQGKIKFNESIRQLIYSAVDDAIDNKDAAGMAYALITGTRSYISKDVRDDIAIAGITHIFAVSGLHIGILAGAVFFLLKKFKTTTKANIITTSSILLLYAYICGFPPSMNRAILMSIMVMYGVFSGRRNDLLSIVSFSAIILLVINPIYIFDLSFLLSYGAVGGIIMLYRPIERISTSLPKWIKPITITSLSTNIAIFPIMARYFNVFSLYFLIANIIILPIIAILYILLLIGTIVAVILPSLPFILTLGGLVLYVIQLITHFISSLPFAGIPVYSMGIFALFYYICILTSSDYVLLKKEYSNKVMIFAGVGAMVGFIYAILSV